MYIDPRNERTWGLFNPSPRGYAFSRSVSGMDQVPVLGGLPPEARFSEMVSFDDFGRVKQANTSIAHFYKSDEKFVRYLLDPASLVRRLSRFGYVLTPDISLSPTMSRWQKTGLTVLSRQVGTVWEDRGLKVIPSLRWIDPMDCDFVFEGLAVESVVAVSTYGSMSIPESRKNLIAGLRRLVHEIRPSKVLIYGSANRKLLEIQSFEDQFQFFRPLHWSSKSSESIVDQQSIF